MKTLVTGGSGFIGSHIVRELTDQGRDVRVLVEEGAGTENLDGLDVERVTGDVRDREAVRGALKGCDSLFHAAAIYALWLPDPSVIYEVNVDGTRIVMEEAADAGVERIVYTSSIAALGVEDGFKSSTEETPFNQWRNANDYIKSKVMADMEVASLVQRGLPAVTVCPAFPFGERDIGPTPTGDLIVKILRRAVPGYLEGGINLVDVEDVAKGHVLAAQKGRAGERYILGNENITIRAFMEMVSDIAGVKAPLRKLPYAAALAIGVGGELLSRFVTKRPPLVTVKTVRYGAQYLYFDIAKAQRELGYAPKPVEGSIERAVRWFREKGCVG